MPNDNVSALLALHGGGSGVTTVSVLAAMEGMTPQQQSEAREAIGAGEPLTDQQLADAASAWLAENITNPSSPPVDKSLSVSNSAADSQVVGDKFSNSARKFDKTGLYLPMPLVFEVGGLANATGRKTTNAARMRSTFLHLYEGDEIVANSPYQFVAYEFDMTGTRYSYVGVLIDAYTEKYVVQSDANVIIVCKRTDDANISSSDLSAVSISVNRKEFKSSFLDGAFTPSFSKISGKAVLLKDGSLTDSQYYETTDFIPVYPGDMIVYTGIQSGSKENGTDTGVAGYDKSKVFVGPVWSAYQDQNINSTNLPDWTSDYVTYTSGFSLARIAVVPSNVFFVRASSLYAERTGYANMPVHISVISNGVKSKEWLESIGESKNPTFVSGSLDSSGTEISSTRRVRTGFIHLENSSIEVKANGQKIAFLFYDSSKAFLLNSGWKYNDFNLIPVATAKYARLVVAEVDDAEITAVDVDASVTVKSNIVSSAEDGKILSDGFVRTPYSQNLEVIVHRGYNSIAPENTLPAFKLARKMGFSAIELDVQLTSDDVPVIIHDNSVARTSNGTGNIYSKTLEQAKALDFGSWKSSMWTGTRIPTFEEALACCKKIGLYIYIEIKSGSPWTSAKIANLVSLVHKYGMDNFVTWISFSKDLIGYVKTANPSAKIGYLMSTYTTAGVDDCVSLRTDTNVVYAVTPNSSLTSAVLEYMIAAGVPLITYLYDTNEACDALTLYSVGILTNEFNAAQYIYKKNID